MIRASGGTWVNYATTIAFQVLFAASFGASRAAGAFVIAFVIAVSVGGVFVSAAQMVIMPRMLEPDGALSLRAVRLVGLAGALTIVAAAGVALASTALAGVVAGASGVGSDLATRLIVIAAALLATNALSGEIGTIALARGRRFTPAVAPAGPTLVGAIYLATTNSPTVTNTLEALVLGSLLQLGLIVASAAYPRPRLASGAPIQVGSIFVLTLILLVMLSLLPPLQRFLAASNDPFGAARLDYALRSMQVGQQLLIGGLLLALLPDWAAAHRRAEQINVRLVPVMALASFLLFVAASIAFVAAPSLTRLVYERGAFTGSDADVVALVVRLAIPGFVAEGLSLVLAQALLASSRNDLALRNGFVRLLIQVPATVLLGVRFGAPGIAVAYSISSVVMFWAVLILCVRHGMLRGGRSLFVRSGVLGTLISSAAISMVVAYPHIPEGLAAAVVAVTGLAGARLIWPIRALRAAIRAFPVRR